MTQDQVLSEVLRERRLELAIESDRCPTSSGAVAFLSWRATPTVVSCTCWSSCDITKIASADVG
jgi:hypothetical protein